MFTPFSLLAETPASVYYEFARLHALSEWWHWLLLIAVCVGIVVYSAYLYRLDSIELPRGLGVALIVLRVLAFVGILVYFLDLEKRTERKLVKNSRVVLLVDTSQSMGLRDADGSNVPGALSRAEHVIQELSRGSLLKELRQRHDVVAYRFDQSTKPIEIASLARFPSAEPGEGESPLAKSRRAFREARSVVLVAAGVFAVSLIAWLVYLIWGRSAPKGEQGSWALLVSMVTLIAALVILAVANLRTPELDFFALLGLREPKVESESSGEKKAAAVEEEIKWDELLRPQGKESHIGDAIRYLVGQEQGGPIAGFAVFSDGGNNGGIECSVAAGMARDAGIPVYTIGLGSDKRPMNVRVVDLEAPQRVYPNDKFTVQGYLQSFGFEGRTVRAELYSAPADSDPKNVDKQKEFVEEQRLQLPPDGEVKTLRFEVSREEAGDRTFFLKVVAPEQDHDPRDNEKSAKVQVVERKNKVLLIAGGPSREFRFLRNQLYRDRDTTVHVWLQTAKPGTAQEGHKLLFDFPETDDDLFQYDCIVGFDPDWHALDELQVKRLEKWVAEKAGGLIVIAGPVYTPKWSRARRGDPRMDVIKSLYPVAVFNFGAPALSLGRFGGDAAWPLNFTREGLDAEFLWLGDTALDSEQNWSAFSGIYGYYAVKDVKLGAKVYARFSDPDTAIDGELPVYMASHFYGAGRVFFQASGEMWRLRAANEKHFEQYYTKLIRWVSQGRLLSDSSRGTLLVDKERCMLGDQVFVRAILQDPQHQPLTDEQVQAILVQPDGTRVALILKAVRDTARQGQYAGQFAALQEGDFKIELKVPGSVKDELLTKEVRARVPVLEIEKPERNDPLLKEIAETTGARYFVGMTAAVQGAGGETLAGKLEPQDQETVMPGTPDKTFERLLMTWLMGLICGVLCLEWLVRRVNKLA